MRTRGHRPILLVLLALGAIAACLAAPSLASALEAPETLEPFIQTHGVTLQGRLSPHSSGEIGATYEFVYRATESGACKGAGQVSTPPGMALGGEAERIFESVEGLDQRTVYAACLVEHNQAGTEEAVGPAVTFLTGPSETPEDEEATDITATSATLKATLNPGGEWVPGGYFFFYQQSGTECEGVKRSEPGVAQGHMAEAVEAAVTGLSPATTYTFCAVAVYAESQSLGIPVTFTTLPAPPTVEGESVVSVSTDEATVSAEISPGGLETTYSVEYEAGKTTPELSLPASSVPFDVRQRIPGLQPGTQYHYRFIAHNALGRVPGESEPLTTATVLTAAGGASCPNATLAGFGPALPDCRADELVSGADQIGEVYDPGGGTSGHEQLVTTARPFRAAADGSSVAYLADPGPVGGDGSSAKGKGNEYLATRGPDGWSATDITPTVADGEPASDERSYEAFSEDLRVGIVGSEAALLGADPVPQAPEGCAALYARNADGAHEFEALFAGTLTPGFCGEPLGAGQTRAGKVNALLFAGETSDHQRLFQSPAALVAPAVETSGVGGNLYVSQGGSLTVANILPNGELATPATYGGPSDMVENAPDLSGATSRDGSRVFFSTVMGEEAANGRAAVPLALYAREDPTAANAATVEVDRAQPGAEGPDGAGQFWGTAQDGQVVFFTDCHRLTVDSTARFSESCQHPVAEREEVRTGNDLYEYDFAKPPGQRLDDLTADRAGGDTLGANVQGVLGVSQDGAYIYFVAGGTLGAGPNRRGEAPIVGTCERATQEEHERYEAEAAGHVPDGLGCNLFELHRNGGTWEAPRFIGTLAALDDAEQGGGERLNAPRDEFGEIVGDWTPDLGSRVAEVTPNGTHLIFSSTQQLTGYDASDVGRASEGVGANEIFVFDALDQSLDCASCDPSGRPPTASIQFDAVGTYAYLPVSSAATFMHRWIDASGTQAFFDSSQPLAGGDGNGTQDVYEWEAEGGPSCPTATSRYGGCVFLLSGGQSQDWSFLVDSDESGENVFVVHRGPLGGAGPRDDKSHLYDVRVNGGLASSSLGCTGTGCQGVPPAAPIFATPASVTFNGVGNLVSVNGQSSTRGLTRSQKLTRALKACHRERPRSKRRRCERGARRRYRPRPSTKRKSSTTRSGS